MRRHFGYCTNVHAGADAEITRDSLRQHAVAVREALQLETPLPVGLWFAAQSAGRLAQYPDTLRRDLEHWQLQPFTLNGFPFGDFHQTIVKHDVYRPTWADRGRIAYTRDLIQLLDAILPPDTVGTISTLPIGWGTITGEEVDVAVRSLLQLATELEQRERSSGRHIMLCLEPEPGCYLQRAADVVRLFDRLQQQAGSDTFRRYLGVCHDVCHAQVMFEKQADVLNTYRSHGIQVGKVQISSNIEMKWQGRVGDSAGYEMLQQFIEPRYLHQTCLLASDTITFFEDLPLALNYARQREFEGSSELRVHFHVPIFLPTIGPLETGRAAIRACLAWFLEHTSFNESELPHIEVETYAWPVLPESLKPNTLSEGIAQELRWLDQQFKGK